MRRVGSGSGRVFAYVDEVDAWLRSRGHSLVANRAALGASAVLEMRAIDAEMTSIQASEARLPFATARFDRTCELLAIAEKMWNTLSALDLGAITRLYREAIDSNPEDAGAFAGITIALIAGGLFDNVTTSSTNAAARFALRQATELDSAHAEVRTANAWVRLVLDRDWNGARCDFDAVLGQRRSFAPAVVGRALSHITDGKLDDAAALLLDFTAQFPLSAPSMIVRCWVEYLAGDAAAARYLIAQVRRAGISGSLLDALDALAMIDPNDPEKSIQPLQALIARWPVHYPQHSLPKGALGYCYAVAGREQDALHILDSLTGFAAGRDTEVDYSRALVSLGLNDFTAAIHWLRESDYGGSLWSFGFAVDPMMASLRATPEYQSMAKGFGHRVSEATNLQLACVS